MSKPTQPAGEWFLDDEQYAVTVAVENFRDTELEVKVKGPKVSDDEYRERLVATKLAQDSTGLHGWTKLELPADATVLDEFITALKAAQEELADDLQEN